MNIKNEQKRQTRPVRVANRIPIPRQRFKELRTSVAGTRRKMAADLDLTEFTIQKIEQGRGDTSCLMLFVFAEYLGTTVYDLFPDIVEEAKAYLKSCNIVPINSLK